MSALVGRPPMLKTRTPGLRVGWRQGIHDKAGVGVLWVDILGEKEFQMTPVPVTYFKQLRTDPDPELLANQLLRMYL